MEEQLLVSRAKRGDQNAFAEIVEHYQTPVYNLAYRMLGNANDAEDAAQETFLRAYTQLKSFHADQRFATWLLAIAAHYCIDRLRRRRFQSLSIEDDPIGETLASDLLQPDDEALRHESQHEVEQLLEHLSPSNRLIVVLKYWYDQSVEEISKTTGDSVSSVKVKLHRARQALGRQLTADGGQPSIVNAVGNRRSAVNGGNCHAK